jgi:hypothetical protein
MVSIHFIVSAGRNLETFLPGIAVPDGKVDAASQGCGRYRHPGKIGA